MTNEEFEPIRIRIINAVKAMCGDVQNLLQRHWVGRMGEVTDGYDHPTQKHMMEQYDKSTQEFIERVNAQMKEKNNE